MVSEIFDASAWDSVQALTLPTSPITGPRHTVPFVSPLTVQKCITAFRPNTVDELYQALEHARCTSDVGCVLLTGNGPSPKDAGWALLR